MNRILIALCFLFTVTTSAFAQNYTKHVVTKGETVTQIAAKYRVTPYDIYRLNPDSQGGVKESDVILIPASSVVPKTPAVDPPKIKTTSAAQTSHTVEPKETLYSIARKYNVSVPDLQSLNASVLAGGLKTGQVIQIPSSGTAKTNTPPPTPAVAKPAPKPTSKPAVSTTSNSHTVEAKETKFGIAKKYGISVAELEKANPSIVSGLPIGFKLVIPGGSATIAQPEKPVTKTPSVEPTQKPAPVITEIVQPETVKTETTKTTRFTGFANYEVKPKETLYSLAQSFDITQEELLMMNPTLKEGVKVGMILKVPGRGSMKLETPKLSAGFSDLTKSLQTSEKKQLVLLLPFNAAKIQGDTLKTIQTRLKKDAFLNMTLDFYSGALMAIDSAKTLGLNIDVRIFDSEESKTGSNVAAVVEKNNLAKAHAVIGPFYQQYAEKVAELLNKNNVPVISPLSKEAGKNFSNLYQSMPPSNFTKSAMLDYMKTKNGNVLIVADPKRLANKEFITTKYPEAKWVLLAENGAVDIENLKSQLVKDRVNYVVMDSEKTGMILSTTNALLNEMSNFQIQLVIIEPNDTLDFEEVSMKRLTLLKLLYPSMTRENESPEARIFENAYKAKNKVFPSQFAVRGFDITFDTLLRLSQAKSFEESAAQDRTQQVESKFEYYKNTDAGYSNKGVFILEYQEDLSVKQVN